MILEKLTIGDFGVFSGSNSFDLAPRKKYGTVRPIVLFGGLNGSGKTTILTAIRLCLYGKQAFGSASQKVYQEAIRNLVHRDPASVVPAQRAEVTLEFTYSQLGAKVQYRVVRVWEERGKSIDEHLGIFRDEKQVEGLTQEQAQAFLNQLIPPGVSQFFFFDGEKIASLAQDQSDDVLAQSVYKLLGLDLVEKLRADLMILLRQRRSEQAGSARAEYDSLSRELQELEADCTRIGSFVEGELTTRLEQARVRVETIKATLAEKGGDWAVDRRGLEQRLDSLVEERRTVETAVREALAERLPFALAPTISRGLLSQLEKEAEVSKSRLLAELLDKDLVALERYLSEVLPKKDAQAAKNAIKAFLQRNTKPRKVTGGAHARLSDADKARIDATLRHGVPAAVASFQVAAERLRKIEHEIEDLSLKLARAPAEASLHEVFENLREASEEVGRLQQQRRSQIEELRRKTWASIDLVRKLRHAEEAILKRESRDVSSERASLVLDVMATFAGKLAAAKVRTLERFFVAAFARLARKEDMISDARIDPVTFAASLIDRHGHVIPKDRLSAGEKQIYAIAMLEALGKASGRQLPVIIDTPLGRLDSRHRNNLVENYFPRASHQVIVLSTDTEVDEPFYQGMSRYVSHAYHLVFERESGATKAEPGYFWRERRTEEGSPRAA